jgi:hypothetical protein
MKPFGVGKHHGNLVHFNGMINCILRIMTTVSQHLSSLVNHPKWGINRKDIGTMTYDGIDVQINLGLTLKKEKYTKI